MTFPESPSELPPGLTYTEDTDTRVAGIAVIASPAGADDAAWQAQSQLNQKMIAKGWIDEDLRTRTTIHVGDVPAAVRTANRDAGQPVTVVHFDYHLRDDPRCECEPSAG